MSVEAVSSQNLSTTTNYDKITAQSKFDLSAITVAQTIAKDVMSELKNKISFIELTKKYTIVNLGDQLKAADADTSNVFEKLYETTDELIKTNTKLKYVAIILKKIYDEHMPLGEQAKKDFLGSYVFTETNVLVAKLKAECPEALNDFEFLKTAAQAKTEAKQQEGKTQEETNS